MMSMKPDTQETRKSTRITGTYLNIGSGDKNLPGFINIDLEPGADIQADVRQGLPFQDNSVDGIFSEHFIEHITQSEGINFFRECRRVLVQHGRVRVATPDLDYIVKRYLSEDWKSNSEMFKYGMDYVQNTCEQLNLTMRSWGHQWVYNEEELIRVATTAGLIPVKRCRFGESDIPAFRGLEYRAGSRLIYEFEKVRPEYGAQKPLVSILIPAYKPTYLREALESAIQQTYPNIEIIVCDDSGGGEIEKIVAQYSTNVPHLKYVKNPENIGGRKNYLKCLKLAQGEFIKYLNDDDILHPTCVERMAECLIAYPEVTLVTSYRQLIDDQGVELPDRSYNRPIVTRDSVIEGMSLANFMLIHKSNVVGEPSTVMFRKADVLNIQPNMFSMGGRPALANGDVTIWINLLGKGNAIYLTDALSFFRIHDAQVQQQQDFIDRSHRAWEQLQEDARRMGFLAPHSPVQPVVAIISPEVDKALQQAQANVKKGKVKEAIDILLQASGSHSHHALLLNELATLYYQIGEKNRALMYFERAVEADGEFINARKNLADLYLELELFNEAFQQFNHILQRNPRDQEVLWIVAQLCQEGGRIDDALFFYKRLNELNPDHPEVAQKIAELTTHPEDEGQSHTKEASTPTTGKHNYDDDIQESTVVTDMENAPRVSIIIPVFNKIEFTRKCLETLYKNTPLDNPETSFEVIVVDNGSTDETPGFLREASEQYPNLYYIINKENLGFSRACNIGAHYARGQYVLFLNNDTEPLPNWLPPLVEILDIDETVAATGSKLLFPDGTIQHAGVAIIDDRVYPDPVAPRHIYYKHPADHPKANEMRTYKVLTAACLLVRKDVFQDVNGFDEVYWNGYEDVDLCFKIYQQGWKLVYQPHSMLIHYEKQSGIQRFIKAFENIEQLHKRWKGNIEPDIILKEDETLHVASRSEMKPYTPPRPLSSIKNVTAASTVIPGAKKTNDSFVSIVILTFNQLHRTRECLDSIQKHTHIPHEVIVVDNGSKDGTVGYLKKWAKKKPNYHVILNKTNRGFAAGNNQGIQQAKGDYIVLLNNDVVVSEKWLEGMLNAFERDYDIGMVGPMTNYISGEQLEPNATYRNMSEFESFARNYRQEHAGELSIALRLVGFCLMIKRDVIEKVGLLDERFGKGNFEDDDYCLRASIMGYKFVIAREVFVHHYGNSTFKGNKIDYHKMLEKNRAIFIEKWKDLDIPQPLWIAHLIEKARNDEMNGDREGQQWALERAFRLTPGDRKILEIYENFLSQNGDGKAIINVLKQYLSARPNDAEVYNLLGVRLWENGDLSEASAYFQQAFQLQPEHPEYMKNLADAHLAQEQFDQAIELYIRLIQTHPEDVEAYEKLAELYIEDGNFQAAAELLDAALAHQPNNESLLEKRRMLNTPRLYVAHHLVKQGQKEMAAQLLAECAKEDNQELGEPELRLIGELYREIGDQQQADFFARKADAMGVVLNGSS